MANEKNISLDNLKTFKKKADATYAKKTDIAAVNNGKLTIQKNGSTVATFTANQSGNTVANITVPTNLVTIDTEQFITGKKHLEAEIGFGKYISPIRSVADAPANLVLMNFQNRNAGLFDAVMLAGAGDWLYLAHLKPEFSIKSSFPGNGSANDTYDANLGYTHNWLDNLTNWDYMNGWRVQASKISAATPAIIQIKFSKGLYTDVLRLILTGHGLNDAGSGSAYSGFLDDYTIEVCTDYSKDTWTTVVNRTNASDNIGKGLVYSLQTGSYTPCCGIRLKITKCHVTGTGYSFINITTMQLRDYRPAIKFPDCLGAISQGGGDVWGQLNTNSNLSTRNVIPQKAGSYYVGTGGMPYEGMYSKAFYENGTALSDKYLAKADSTYAKKTDVAGAVGGWTLMRSIGTKVYSYLPTNIKPSTSTHAASGAPASAGKCLVDVSFFKKQGSLDGTKYPFFKTVIDVTYQGPLFELTPFAVRIGAIPYAYKWYMPRVTVSRGSMNSAWFNYMMKSLAGQADGNLVGITFEDVTVARQLLSGNLGGNGIVAPQGGLNEDGFNLFTILMELDTANDSNLAVTGCHYRIVLTHPDNVMMPDE